jgi:dTDP-4-dehydrorhamnose reductase
MTHSILVTGAGGQVAHELAIAESEHRLVALSKKQLDITDPKQINDAFDEHHPDVVINAAAYTQVDRAEEEAALAYAINRDAVSNLTLACNRIDIPLLHISTDYVFDGNKSGAYNEDDETAPTGVYGASKAAGESVLQSVLERHIILRTSWVFSATGNNFVKTMLRFGGQRDELNIVNDQHGCPTSAQSIAAALLQITESYLRGDVIEWGTYHFCSQPETTWHGFAKQIFQQTKGFENLKLNGIPTSEYPTLATRPLNSVLDCSKFVAEFKTVQPDWREDLDNILEQLGYLS